MKIGNAIAGVVTEAVKGVASTGAGELKKAGKSMFGQVSGSSPSASSTPEPKSGGGLRGGYNFSARGETKKFGMNIVSQLSGKKFTYQELEQMKHADEEFSSKAHQDLRAKINRTYGDYAKKRQQERTIAQQQQVQEKQEQKKESQLGQKDGLNSIDPAIQKTRAEIKNYGAE